ncbi:hypothetical protein U9M48_040885 [Paspalum notatum var. saurae]|uniref:DUF4220 domain-containing protein n=1 Tax=Paspalum notatum var. saurae TaxID=547442 RepID=A0AAQ3XE90_PASNO
MRPIRSGEEVGGRNLVEKQSLAAIHEAWNLWEIHSLMLVSLFLQVFLFFTAGLWRRKTPRILCTVFWLAYLSADAVAIFVLGHLAIHASEPGHQLMSFWAPSVLVRLREIFGHRGPWPLSAPPCFRPCSVLNLFTQVAIAGYIVAKASWHNRLLSSAMVLVFVSGCFKYGERTLCLFQANPTFIRSAFQGDLSEMLAALQSRKTSGDLSEMLAALRSRKMSGDERSKEFMRRRYELMLQGSTSTGDGWGTRRDELFLDVPPNMENSILAVDSLPDLLLDKFQSSAGRYGAYVSVGASLCCSRSPKRAISSIPAELMSVSYILLIGAVALDMSAVIIFFLSICIPSSIWRRKQWSEELRQYNMIRRHVVQDTTGILSSIQQWIGRHLGDRGVGLLDLTHVPITQPITALILDNLLLHGTRKEWHAASSRGQLAVQNWKQRHQNHSASESIAQALANTISSVADFPTSVLMWHLATDICYYYSGDADSTTNNHSNQEKEEEEEENKVVSRQISNYIMYPVFKCGVKLTPNSQHLHNKTHDEIRETLSDPQQQQRRHVTGGEKAAFMKIFEAKKKEGEDEEQYHSTFDGITTQEKHEEPAASNGNNPAENHV